MGELPQPPFDASHTPKPEIKTTEQKLASIGLTPEAIRGKQVLDIHSGESTFGQMSPGEIRALDTQDPDVDYEALPFPDSRFDLITVTDGDLQGDPGDEYVITLYQEALRIINDTGEIRVADPFQGYTPQETDPGDWKPEQELAYLLSQAGIDVSTKMVTPEENPDLTEPYLILKKLPSQEQ